MDKENATAQEPLNITVYRSPTCGCCGKWLDHLKKHQFNVVDIKLKDMQTVKRKHGVPANLASCHTAIINGYIIEGHVPAGDIKRLLVEKPMVSGLSVPAMPSGTPGMEMGGRKDPFTVISFDQKGKLERFTEYPFY